MGATPLLYIQVFGFCSVLQRCNRGRRVFGFCSGWWFTGGIRREEEGARRGVRQRGTARGAKNNRGDGAKIRHFLPLLFIFWLGLVDIVGGLS